MPWTHRVLIGWRFTLKRRKRKLLLNALLPVVVVLVMAIFLSVVGWRLLSLVRPSGGQQVAAVQQLRVAVPVVGALVVFITVYVQVQSAGQ